MKCSVLSNNFVYIVTIQFKANQSSPLPCHVTLVSCTMYQHQTSLNLISPWNDVITSPACQLHVYYSNCQIEHVWDLKYSERVNIPGVYLVSTYSGVLLTHEQNSIYTLYACAIAQYILYRIFEKWIKCWNQYTWRTTSLYLKAMMNESRILRCFSCYFVRWWCGEMHPIRPRFVANISDQCPQQK